MENIKREPIKLLILSYHYLPLNVIASYRPAGFAQHLYKFGIYPTIVTHRWELDENQKWILHKKNDEVVVEKNDQYQVIRLPRYHTFRGNLSRWFEKFPIARRFLILIQWLTGYLDPGPHNTDSYIAYKKFLIRHLKKHSYDLLMGIYSPHHHMRLCYELSNIYHIPYFIDLRDVWPGNRKAKIQYSSKVIERFEDYFVKFYWKRWFSNAVFFTITSDPWKNILEPIVGIDGFVVTNAFDKNISSNYERTSSNFFQISHIGTIYPQQNIEILLKAIKSIIEKNQGFKIKLNFIGIKPDMKERLTKMIGKYDLEKVTKVEKRIPRNQALQIMNNSNVLFYPTWPNIPGTYSGKIFDYLASGSIIMAFPDDKSVIANLLEETKSGVILNSFREMVDFIKNEYFKWGKNRNSNQRKTNLIDKYSRENQTKILAGLITNIMKIE